MRKKLLGILLLVVIPFFTMSELDALDTSYKEYDYYLNGQVMKYYEVIKYYESIYEDEIIEHTLDIVDGEIYFEFIEGTTVDTRLIEVEYNLDYEQEYQLLLDMRDFNLFSKYDKKTMNIVIVAYENNYVVAEHYYWDVSNLVDEYYEYLENNPKSARASSTWVQDRTYKPVKTDYKTRSTPGINTISDLYEVRMKKLDRTEWKKTSGISEVCKVLKVDPSIDKRWKHQGKGSCKGIKSLWQHQSKVYYYDYQQQYQPIGTYQIPEPSVEGEKTWMTWNLYKTDAYVNKAKIIFKEDWNSEGVYYSLRANATDNKGNVLKNDDGDYITSGYIENIGKNGYDIHYPGEVRVYAQAHYDNIRNPGQKVGSLLPMGETYKTSSGWTHEIRLYIHKDLDEYRTTNRSVSTIANDIRTTCTSSNIESEKACIQKKFPELISAILYESYSAIFDENLSNKRWTEFLDLAITVNDAAEFVTFIRKICVKTTSEIIKMVTEGIPNYILSSYFEKMSYNYFGQSKIEITLNINAILDELGINSQYDNEFIFELYMIIMDEQLYYMNRIYNG